VRFLKSWKKENATTSRRFRLRAQRSRPDILEERNLISTLTVMNAADGGAGSLRQVEPDGRQPAELTRTKSFGYCVFNPEALTTLASLGERVGVDLWHYTTTDGRSIRKAFDWMIPYATGAKAWPYEQIAEIKPTSLRLPLRRAANAYHEPSYEEVNERLTAESQRPGELLELLHAPGPAK
jgi:hypothetical protein